MLWKLNNPWGIKLGDLDWAAFAALWPLAGDEKPKDSWSLNEGPCRLTDDEAIGLVSLGISIAPVPYPGAMVTKMQDRAKWEHGVDVSPEHLNDCRAVHIAIPDLGLLRMRKVTVLEDACTDELQAWLDKGWRILAVCPPNAARRPDYILGSDDLKAYRGR